eukprot:9162280-Pyramimonas_sp.AAC.1
MFAAKVLAANVAQVAWTLVFNDAPQSFADAVHMGFPIDPPPQLIYNLGSDSEVGRSFPETRKGPSLHPAPVPPL